MINTNGLAPISRIGCARLAFDQIMIDYPTNPYSKLPDAELENINVWIAVTDKRLVSSVFGRSGLWQPLFATFFQSIANELRERNITHWTPDSARILREIIERRTATCSPSADRPLAVGDDRGGTPPSHTTLPGSTQQSAESHSSPKIRRRKNTPTRRRGKEQGTSI